jgi:hypothetical protein
MLRCRQAAAATAAAVAYVLIVIVVTISIPLLLPPLLSVDCLLLSAPPPLLLPPVSSVPLWWHAQIMILKEDPHGMLDPFLMPGSILWHVGKPSL